ncbi:hypothetical protein [Paenibacillus elgii]|uniref:Uncharacterized protein n=1 Tax=Paenibacillus elgii TaxID=189691 RepID=A0A163UCF7_9BACL|nr:hypothetical protein [Paenibacillus elgii]KZE73137.1 hypothetical protein AV654_32910 [Paenibacillus elgii]MCM3271798.1 hypothetical protein [Paenibacillus elgii]NEN82743.1 hypothetical protein [Paenibacillus elgii]PUA38345.1 hypothetical protein C8Z91_15280 [Paenibacillus elgii]
MISNRELKGQIEELTEQNQFLSDELQQIKSLLESQSNNQDQGSNQGKGNQGEEKSNNGSDALFNMANDFIKLKKLTSDLQTKMQEYASQQTRGSQLTDEDVINLIINMMNGMIDWTIDFVSKQNQSQGQGQMH